MSDALRVVTAGGIGMLQDLGRAGMQRFGVPVSGALDSVSLRIANAIVGNEDGTAAIEMFYQGPTLDIEAHSVRMASIGAPLHVIAGERRRAIPPGRSVFVRRGDRVAVGPCSGTLVAYLAIEGGFTVPEVLGSQSTFVRAGFGGLDGRLLRKGDTLPLALPAAPEREERSAPAWDLAPPARVRIVFGPQDDYFTARGRSTLTQSIYSVSTQSDRIGMRLQGPVIEHARGFDIVSDGTVAGSIQVPGNGLPIVLLADRPTTGGYPKIATVASADVPALGRLRPGTRIGFDAISVEQAEQARRELEARIAQMRSQLMPGFS